MWYIFVLKKPQQTNKKTTSKTTTLKQQANKNPLSNMRGF